MRAAATVLGTLALAGCGGTGAQPSLQAPVHYTRGGGIAGVQDELVIAPDGSARLSGRGVPMRRFGVSRADREALAQALGEVDWSARPGRPIPDAFGYGVSYRGRTVSAQDGEVPPRLAPLLGRLGTIARRHGLR
jgi:hypothetical protein